MDDEKVKSRFTTEEIAEKIKIAPSYLNQLMAGEKLCIQELRERIEKL